MEIYLGDDVRKERKEGESDEEGKEAQTRWPPFSDWSPIFFAPVDPRFSSGLPTIDVAMGKSG